MAPHAHALVNRSVASTERLGEHVREVFHEAKPKLRGWLHLGIAPLTLAAGIVLVWLSPSTSTRIGSAVFVASAVVLFTVSAIYHRGNWSPAVWKSLRRFDHANIFVLIAGSYTPFAVLLLEGRDQVVLLSLAWGGAVLGIGFRVFWIDAPRWLYTPIYIAFGGPAIYFFGDFVASAGGPVLTFMTVGGALYAVGGLVYLIQRPNPIPLWFGFHEVFHSLTIIAFITHYVGISIATYSLR